MSDRLKQIWSGFEGQTTRHLTGNGVDNVHVPDRREWRAEDQRFLPEQFENPATRAFNALQYKLSEVEQKHRKKRKQKDSETILPDGHDFAVPNFARNAYGHAEAHEKKNYMVEGDPRQALLASLKETDFRILRREINYLAQGAADTERQLKAKPRKKFLGLF